VEVFVVITAVIVKRWSDSCMLHEDPLPNLLPHYTMRKYSHPLNLSNNGTWAMSTPLGIDIILITYQNTVISPVKFHIKKTDNKISCCKRIKNFSDFYQFFISSSMDEWALKYKFWARLVKCWLRFAHGNSGYCQIWLGAFFLHATLYTICILRSNWNNIDPKWRTHSPCTIIWKVERMGIFPHGIRCQQVGQWIFM